MACKILVVDDEPAWEELIKSIFENQIIDKKWDFMFARNGRIALEKLKENPDVAVVLLDLNMPEMDGLTFLRNFNTMDIHTIKVIVVTAYGDMENIRASMNEGAFDFLTKPINFNDLKITIEKALKQSGIIKKALTEHDELVALKKELEIASHIQEAMAPKKLPTFLQQKDVDIYAKTIPAKEVGGDFYDFFQVDQDRLAFTVGDVSGKGISAALYMAKMCTLFKTTASRFINPEECFLVLNNLLIAEKGNDSGLFVTIFYGLLNLNTGVCHYSCAGHPAPYIVDGAGKVEQMPDVGGCPLCLFENSEYESKRIRLKKGDTLVIYTDGVTDAMNPAKMQFGDENRLFKYLEGVDSKPLNEIIERLIAAIRDFAQDTPQSDDITLLALRRN
ncbi:MAG: SpoIIE family protein phosphatase [Candidatus Aminicenantes bacterium]|nr:SpoIIE family protein phosphatase [Candidatus Aminicenantes bacterium]